MSNMLILFCGPKNGLTWEMPPWVLKQMHLPWLAQGSLGAFRPHGWGYCFSVSQSCWFSLQQFLKNAENPVAVTLCFVVRLFLTWPPSPCWSSCAVIQTPESEGVTGLSASFPWGQGRDEKHLQAQAHRNSPGDRCDLGYGLSLLHSPCPSTHEHTHIHTHAHRHTQSLLFAYHLSNTGWRDRLSWDIFTHAVTCT